MNNDTDPDQRATLVTGGTGTLGTVVPVYGRA